MVHREPCAYRLVQGNLLADDVTVLYIDGGGGCKNQRMSYNTERSTQKGILQYDHFKTKILKD